MKYWKLKIEKCVNRKEAIQIHHNLILDEPGWFSKIDKTHKENMQERLESVLLTTMINFKSKSSYHFLKRHCFMGKIPQRINKCSIFNLKNMDSKHASRQFKSRCVINCLQFSENTCNNNNDKKTCISRSLTHTLSHIVWNCRIFIKWICNIPHFIINIL